MVNDILDAHQEGEKINDIVHTYQTCGKKNDTVHGQCSITHAEKKKKLNAIHRKQ